MSSDVNPKRGRPIDTAKRDGIVASAISAFFEHGFAAVSIEQIAAQAGVSKVTIYNQFGDKRGLFTAAVEAECERMAGYFSIDESAGGTWRDRLTAIGHGMVAFLSRPEMIQFERRIAAETVHDPEIGAAFLAAGPHRMKKALASVLKALTQAGHLRIGDADLAAEQFASMCKGMGDLERRFGHPSDGVRDRQRIDSAVSVFCRAYSP